MPLLRRNSNQDTDSMSPEELSNTRPSLLHRLSRRSSREHVKQTNALKEHVPLEHDGEHGDVQPSQPATLPASTVVTERLEGDANPTNGLSKEDVRALFFGAPHFMLEKGRHGKSFPQAFFPWNTDLEVSDLEDRRYLSHESFALITLHAHLPIPDELSWKASSLPQAREAAWKRPMMDMGIFETPNMLSVQGREPGTVGLRFFLEVPISEKLRTIEKAKEEEKGCASLAHMSANEALKKEADKPRTGKRAQRVERIELIEGGPERWEQLGLRNVTASTIIQRLAMLCNLHDEVVEHGLGDTILHRQSCAVLYDELFSKLLYPPTTLKEDDQDKEHRAGLKIQIESLVKVLTTPGAWIDFSLVEPRIRLGQGLWQLPPYEGQFSDTGNLSVGAERKWLLLQILLSIELRVRLDAALRLGSSDQFRDFQLTGDEIHHFNKLRNLKVDWDLVVARRFIEMVIVQQGPKSDIKSLLYENANQHSHLPSMFKKKMQLDDNNEDISIWSCEIVPRRNDAQFQGLLRFARMIRWPCVDDLESDLSRRYNDPSVPHGMLFAQPIPSMEETSDGTEKSTGTTGSLFSGDNWTESACVFLKPAHGVEMGGFLGRTWLMGLVMPGEAGCMSVMACLLEQDKRAHKLGTVAYLHGGFVLDGCSYWSKVCILGRVLAPAKGTECMGWVNTSECPPLDHHKVAFKDTWLNVIAQMPPQTRKGLRIYDGQKLADDSNVLGEGKGKILSSEYTMITDKVLDHLVPVMVELRDLVLRKPVHNSLRDTTLTATLTFAISAGNGPPSEQDLKLTYQAGFVSSRKWNISSVCKNTVTLLQTTTSEHLWGHFKDIAFSARTIFWKMQAYPTVIDPCRPPHGHAMFASALAHEHAHHKAHERLPSHPLHKSFLYKIKSISDLRQAQSPPQAGRDHEVWIIDARDSPAHDIFARAWCSQTGRNAIVSRVGQCCLSCSIREAFALEINLIIRVGLREGG